VSTVLTIRQGETCTIIVSSIVDHDDEHLDVTGWAVHAMARPSALSSTLWQEWATNPTGTQGTARIVSGRVELVVPHTMSSAWTWSGQTGVLHVEVTEPDGEQRRARVCDRRIYLDPEAVR
jgi:hypothetical protein